MVKGFVDNMDAVRAQQMQRPQQNLAKKKKKIMHGWCLSQNFMHSLWSIHSFVQTPPPSSNCDLIYPSRSEK